MRRSSSVLNFTLIFWLFFSLLWLSTAKSQPGSGTDKKTTTSKTAAFFIPRFETTFQTQTGKLLSSILPTLIQASLQGDQYNWLKVVTDTTFVPDSGNNFKISGIIRDYSDVNKVNLQISYIDSLGKTDKIAVKNYLIVADSILVQVDRMSRELASIVRKHISVSELSILIYPFESFVQDSTLNEIGEFLALSFSLELEYIPIISNVKIMSPEINENQISKTFDLILTGAFNLDRDSLEVSVTMLDTETKKRLYSVSTHLSEDDLLDAPGGLVDKLRNFLEVFRDIREELFDLESEEDFYKKGEEYLQATDDSKAKVKAEVMYYNAIEVNPLYIPALIRLGNIYASEQKYDNALSIYNLILKIDSLNTEAHLGLGETYYNTDRESLAVEHFEYAVELGRIQKDKSATAKAYEWLGYVSRVNGSYDESIDYFEKALELEQDVLSIWHGIGVAHFFRYETLTNQTKDTTDIYWATEYFRRAMRKFPDDSTLVWGTAYLLNYWGKVYYNEYIKLFDDTSFSVERLELLSHLSCTKFEEAVQIKTYDNNLRAESYNHLAWFANEKFEKEKAKELSKRAVELNPDDEWTYRLFAFLHSDDTLHLEEALKNVKQALSIEKRSSSYRISGEIFLNMHKYDSAYVAFQNAYQIDTTEGYVSFSTAKGLFKSALKSENPERLENVIRVFDTYLEQGVTKDDSLWTYIYLAEVSRKQSEFEVALDHVKQALKVNTNSEAALGVLDSLYFMDSFEQALKLKISTLEENVKANGTLFQFLTLADAYVRIKSYEKSFDAIDSAFQISTTKEDTAWIHGIKSFIFYQQGLDAYSEEDTASGRVNMEKAMQHANETIDVYPKWPLTLNMLQVIHHEYIIDYEKSYQVSQELLLLDSLNTDYITNEIEACLTSGRSDLAYKKADAILSSDTLGKQPLELEKKLAMKFILMTSLVLKGNPTDAFSEFGDFERHYRKRTEREEDWWSYRGTERFLRENKKLDPSFRDLLLKMIEALNSEKKKGLGILKKVETAWKNLITEIK